MFSVVCIKLKMFDKGRVSCLQWFHPYDYGTSEEYCKGTYQRRLSSVRATLKQVRNLQVKISNGKSSMQPSDYNVMFSHTEIPRAHRPLYTCLYFSNT